MIVLAALVTPKTNALPLFPYLLGYGLFNSLGMRAIRIFSYLHEWIFNGSFKDNYVPEKVRMMRKW